MIIENIINQLNPGLPDDLLVEAIQDQEKIEEAIEYFIEEYWSIQPLWVREWTMDLLDSGELDSLDFELYQVLKGIK